MKQLVVLLTVLALMVPIVSLAGQTIVREPEFLGTLQRDFEVTNGREIYFICSQEKETKLHFVTYIHARTTFYYLHQLEVGDKVWKVKAKNRLSDWVLRGEYYLYIFYNHEPAEYEYDQLINEWAKSYSL